jgi:hypothetical protein
MEQFPNTRQHIEIRVNNRIVNGVEVAQMARFLELIHKQAEDAQCSFRLVVRTTMHELVGEQVGPALSGPEYTPYPVILRADNDTIRNKDGSIYATRQHPLPTAEEWAATCAGAPPTAYLEGDYFEHMRKTSAVLMDDMIMFHMYAAIPLGRYNGISQ